MRRLAPLFLLVACDNPSEVDPCGRVALEVRGFTGDRIDGNAMSCSDGPGWCAQQAEAGVIHGECGSDVSVVLTDRAFAAGRLRLDLKLGAGGEVSQAFAVSSEAGQDVPGTGWVMPEETSKLGRVSGRYALSFDDGTHSGVIEGTYDVPGF